MRRAVRHFLALIACITLAACSRGPTHAPLPRGAVVLAFGDSVTHGTGAGNDEDYPSRLARLTGWEVHNHGIPGDTAVNARGRIQAALDETRPALVIVELGGNDFLRRQSEATVKESLRAIVRAAKRDGRPVALVGVPRLSLVGAAVGALSDAPLYEELADEENLVLIEDVFSDILSTPDLRADAIHPNAQGYERLAAGIAAALKESGLIAR